MKSHKKKKKPLSLFDSDGNIQKEIHKHILEEIFALHSMKDYLYRPTMDDIVKEQIKKYGNKIFKYIFKYFVKKCRYRYYKYWYAYME